MMLVKLYKMFLGINTMVTLTFRRYLFNRSNKTLHPNFHFDHIKVTKNNVKILSVYIDL